MSVDQLNREFREHVRAIMFSGVNMDSAISKIGFTSLKNYIERRLFSDRALTIQWLKRLRDQNDRSLESCMIRNQYAEALRIMVDNTPVTFCMPFKEEPPKDELTPLLEALSNSMHNVVPDLPKCGPLKPILFHRSADHRAYMNIKRCPDGGIFCYMAVAPEPLQFGQLTKRVCTGAKPEDSPHGIKFF